MLVLGRDRVSWLERLLMGAVTSQVVGQVACPLVVVPRGRRTRLAWPQLPVIVALDGETAPEPALVGVRGGEAACRSTDCATPSR